MSEHSASRVARLDEQRVLDDQRFRQALHALAEQQHCSLSETENYARRCLEELAVHPQDRYLDLVASLARFMYTRSYAGELNVNADALVHLKQLAKQHPMVFLWSHKSHLDSFVFMRAMYDAGFTPQPLSFAGINMNFAGFGALAKRSGAIFLRRSFKDDPVYKLVLQHYIDYLVAERVPLSWSIEGTRSRTGMMMPPKLGLLQWVLEAYQRASVDDVLLVPVAIGFDQIAEIDDYVAMQRGLPKRKESLQWFVGYIAGMRAPYGRIYVRFAEPVALSDSVPVPDAMLHGGPEQIHVQKLAFAVCNRIERAKPITATDLVTLTLLAANGRALQIPQIQRHVVDMMKLIADRELPTASDLPTADQAGLGAAVSALTATGLMSRSEDLTTPGYVITAGHELAAAYYRNTVAHYFLNYAVAETAIASVAAVDVEPEFWDAVMRLRELLKFDFFFQRKEEFRAEIAAYMDFRYPDWRSAPGTCLDNTPPLFGPGILRSFLEAYRIVAAVLGGYDGDSLTADDDDDDSLITQCLRMGEGMLADHQLSTETALSQPLIANAIRLADYRRLLRGSAGELRSARTLFTQETEQAMAAINRLQDDYDRGWANAWA